MERKSRKGMPAGTWPLLIAACMFVVVGVLALKKPTSFTMSGGTGKSGGHAVTYVVSEGETPAFGYGFLCVAGLLGYFAYLHARGN